MNKLVITQDNSRTEYPVPNAVITALYNIGKDDDQNLSLTEGVDTTNSNRPVSTVSGSIRVATAYAHHLLYIAVKYPNLSITADSTYIYFADPEVERVLLAAGIGDGVGVSVQDASQATINSSVFLGNSTIASFNEFGYFTRANSNPQNALFKNCTALSQIDLSNVSTISNEEFRNTAINTLDAPNLQFFSGEHLFNTCSELTSVTNLGSVINIPGYCFYNCEKLETVTLPLSCTTIVRNAFLDCKSLTDINLDDVTTIEDAAFQSCKALDIYTSKLLNCTSIGNYSLLNTHRIAEDIFLPNLLIAGKGIFRETRGSYKATCLGKISKIPDNMFMNPLDNTGPTQVYLPYECTEIGILAFQNNKSLTTIKQYTQSVDDWVDGQPSSYGECVNITTLARSCFSDCSSLTSLTLGNITSVPSSAFANCTSLTSLNIQFKNLSSIGGEAFRNAAINWGVLVYFGEYFSKKELSDGTYGDDSRWVFGGNTFEQLYLPKLKASYAGGVYSNFHTCITFLGTQNSAASPKYGLLYMRDLESLFPAAFANANITSLVINNTTVPKCYNREKTLTPSNGLSKDLVFAGLPGTTKIYVPDTSINDYKTADVWSTVASQIYPMSELTRYATEADWVAAGKPATGLIEAYM